MGIGLAAQGVNQNRLPGKYSDPLTLPLKHWPTIRAKQKCVPVVDGKGFYLLHYLMPLRTCLLSSLLMLMKGLQDGW